MNIISISDAARLSISINLKFSHNSQTSESLSTSIKWVNHLILMFPVFCSPAFLATSFRPCDASNSKTYFALALKNRYLSESQLPNIVSSRLGSQQPTSNPASKESSCWKSSYNYGPRSCISISATTWLIMCTVTAAVAVVVWNHKLLECEFETLLAWQLALNSYNRLSSVVYWLPINNS